MGAVARISEFRRHKGSSRWVIIAPGRLGRPVDFSVNQSTVPQIVETIEEKMRKCPFCPGNEDRTPQPTILQYIKGGQWQLRVVPNKYPAVSIIEDCRGVPLRQEKLGIRRRLPGYGAHEVIVDMPHHGEVFADFSSDRLNDLFWAYRERISDLRKDPHLKYVLIFRNEGEAAGASLEHSHCQLIGLPVIPPLIHDEIIEARDYYQEEESCLYCDLVSQEIDSKELVFFESECAVALTPYASRSPFEVWVIPKEHMPRYEESVPSYIRCIAETMGEVAKRLAKVLNNAPYNFYLHNGPLRDEELAATYHHHFEFVPRITKLGGFEWGSGLYINFYSPGEAAALLRDVKV